MKKKIIGSLMAFALTIAAAAGIVQTGIPVMAAEIKTFVTQEGTASLGNGTASVVINGNRGQSLIGKEFYIYNLFHTINAVDGESVNYTFTEECRAALQNVVGDRLGKVSTEVTEYEVVDYIRSLSDTKAEGAQTEQTEEGYYSAFRYFIEDLRTELVNLDADITAAVSIADVRSDGSVLLDGMEYGYYIIDEVTDNSEVHAASSLCIVSTANPNASVKIKSDYPSLEKKILEDDAADSVGNNGWSDMADFEIGQTISYKCTSNVPNMNGYDTYYYAWHDVMDEALIFDTESVNITIYEGDKEYTLAENEYKVTEMVNDETFAVEIADLKSIVDANFNHMDELGHNTYGQEVVLTYQAVLGDDAALDTGRPGFENDARLEFSNDPDSDGEGKTGFTPWDTVVCFTYKLNGLKVNNYDKVLADAKFHLYSDEDCENEVYVKKTENGYNIINQDSSEDAIPADAAEIVSDENGVFTIFGLDCGTYYLKETEAPSGYRAIQDPVTLEVASEFAENRNSYVKGVTEDALIELVFSANIRQFLDGVLEEEDLELESDISDGSGNLTVVNTVGSKLPVTGSSATIILLGVGSAMMIIAGKYGKKNKSKKRIKYN